MAPLKVALPSKGRMAAGIRKLFGDAGLALDDFDATSALASVIDDRYEVIFVRAKDVPAFVADGVADIGVTGWDLVCESEHKLIDLLDLGIGKCHLAVAAHQKSGYTSVEDLPNKLRVATTFPNLARNFLTQKGLSVEIVGVSGSTEIAPHLGLADVVVDLIATGSTMRRNGLSELETIMTSSARLIAAEDREDLKPLMLLLDSVLQARHRRYLMANIPTGSLDQIRSVLPGLNGATVMSLLGNDDVVAIHAVVGDKEIDSVITQLRSLGAEGIIVTPIERLVP